MKGRGRRGPEESEDDLFFVPAVGDETFCLPEPASVHNAYLQMPIPFCNACWSRSYKLSELGRFPAVELALRWNETKHALRWNETKHTTCQQYYSSTSR